MECNISTAFTCKHDCRDRWTRQANNSWVIIEGDHRFADNIEGGFTTTSTRFINLTILKSLNDVVEPILLHYFPLKATTLVNNANKYTTIYIK